MGAPGRGEGGGAGDEAAVAATAAADAIAAAVGDNTHLVTVATCNLDQWALDFDGNLDRVRRSILEAKSKGARYRLGPELELCGYGCEDHFLEQDTFLHCDESLAELLQDDTTRDILCDIGMPVLHNGVRYNCRVYCLDGKIVLIRPKLFMADDGNYRESRYFSTWKKPNSVASHMLSPLLQRATGQVKVPFGQAAVSAMDTMVATETCEELWTPRSPHIEQSLAGVEIHGNGSGSHHQLRKLSVRFDYILAATMKCGGVYLYANQRGCDGGRLYYDGCALIACNGKVLAQASQFSLKDVEVVTATIDLQDVRTHRASCSSLMEQSSRVDPLPLVSLNDFWLTERRVDRFMDRIPTPSGELRIHSPEEECGMGPACWLWDYLCRSGASGYFLPLSGGADSSSVAAICGVMCHMAVEAAPSEPRVASNVRRLMGLSKEDPLPHNASQLAECVLHTTYMGTENSSKATNSRARLLAGEIGAYHCSVSIDMMVKAVVGCFELLTGKIPRFSCDGGADREDLALQNIQARLRMVLSYVLAQLLPWVRGRGGFLLVLSSANVDEALRGYMTKYDCSSADLNPIGAISKVDLKRLLRWAAERFGYGTLKSVVEAPPTAELRPMVANGNGGGDGDGAEEEGEGEHSQTDEEDMGMTYEELSHFGTIRKIGHAGPVTMYKKLLVLWHHLSPSVVAEKVKRFFFFYSVNRHKLTTLTPSYHAESYSPDDNRFDLRPFLYNAKWSRQFRDIDRISRQALEVGSRVSTRATSGVSSSSSSSSSSGTAAVGATAGAGAGVGVGVAASGVGKVGKEGALRRGMPVI